MADIYALNAALRKLAENARQGIQRAGYLARAAQSLAAAERYEDAAVLYREALDLHRGDAGLYREAAAVLRRAGRSEEAFGHLIEGLRPGPDAVATHYMIGQVLAEEAGGEAAYLDAVWPDRASGMTLGDAAHAEPRLQGHLLVARQVLDEAAESYRAAAGAGDERAAACVAEALRLAGRTIEAARAEGERLLELDDAEGAQRAYKVAREAGDSSLTLYEGLGRSLILQQRYDEAIAVCRTGLRSYPDAQGLERNWLWALQHDGRRDEAVVRAKAFASRHPHGFVDWVQHLALPVLYADTAEAEDARVAYEAGMDALEAEVPARAKIERWGGFLRSTSFLLAYQGEDDRVLQERYGRILQRVTASLLPERLPAPPRPLDGRKLRIGYASPFWRGHTIAKLFSGWVKHHDPARTDVFVYQLGGRPDITMDLVRAQADVFRRLPIAVELDRYAQAAAQIIDDDLDVLVYPSVGMHPATVALASRRLAPVQAVAWGHPVTTGLDTIDYFLSSELMEPAGADAHYTERLVRLPGTSIAVAHAEAPGKATRADFGLEPDDVVFHSPQSLFKYHPRYDWIYPAIAARVPGAVFTFLEYRSAHVTRQFIARMEQAFRDAGLDPLRHIVMMPRMTQNDFLDACLRADVYLDTPGWSGGMTSLEALSTGLPAVTWPGPFMRGRHTYAFLRTLDLPELIADDLEDYVEIAVRLGNDPAQRATLRSTILDRSSLLYDDVRPVRALEDFYAQAVDDLT